MENANAVIRCPQFPVRAPHVLAPTPDRMAVLRVVLVNMPWAPVNLPALALEVVSGALRRESPDVDAEVRYANLDFVDWLAGRAAFDFTCYQYFSRLTSMYGIGEWVFSSALYDDAEWRVDEFLEHFAGRIPEREIDLSRQLHRLAPDFFDLLAEQIVATHPAYVGFHLGIAALATAARIKKLDPDIRTVMGGVCCDGEPGAAVHRNFPCIDFVVRGEGEHVFANLLGRVARGDPLDDIAGLCWETSDGRRIANPMSDTPLDAESIAVPDFTAFFERFRASRADGWVEPWLIVESSRGCWWGASGRCTFCGINGLSLQYRSKPVDAFFDEVTEHARRHHTLDLLAVDRNLAMGYPASLASRVKLADYDMRFQYAVSANLNGEAVRALADAGVVNVQVGIENLSNHVLTLMRKGVTGCQNVRILRDGESNGIIMHWNYLYGFPGETDEDYLKVIAQCAALHHLRPPDSVSPIFIERFSPYFDDPGLGFSRLTLPKQYPMTFDLPEQELRRLAFLFGMSTKGMGGATAAVFRAAVDGWRAAYSTSSLTHHDLGDVILLINTRARFDWHVLRLSAQVEVDMFRCLERPASPAALANRLDIDVAAVTSMLRAWQELGIVFTDGRQFVHLAPRAMNQHLLKLGADDLARFTR